MNCGSLLTLSLSIALSACNVFEPKTSEWIALTLIILAGMPHGAFDLRVAQVKWSGDRRTQVIIIVTYIVAVFAMASLCLWVPLVGLLVFLLISLIHFYEGERYASSPPDRLQGFLFGLGAIALPIGLHVAEAKAYVSYFVPDNYVDAAASPMHYCAIVLCACLALSLLGKLIRSSFCVSSTLLQRFVCLIAWVSLPPLAGFSVWFIGRHSLRHIQVCRQMCKDVRVGVSVDFILISAIAIGGLIPFTMLFNLSDIHQLFTATICLVAGLTLPHMIVSHGTHRGRES
jgi:Brp/Blh family beta-carotene 15,15'-monooxygenase